MQTPLGFNLVWARPDWNSNDWGLEPWLFAVILHCVYGASGKICLSSDGDKNQYKLNFSLINLSNSESHIQNADLEYSKLIYFLVLGDKKEITALPVVFLVTTPFHANSIESLLLFSKLCMLTSAVIWTWQHFFWRIISTEINNS